jgi:hypothetical protein
MKKLFLAALLLIPETVLAIDLVTVDSTDVFVDLKVLPQTLGADPNAGKTGIAFDAAGLVCSYHRDTGSRTAITLISGTHGTHADGAWSENQSTHEKGIYQIAVPDAAFATGARYVSITCYGASDMQQADKQVLLIAGPDGVGDIETTEITAVPGTGTVTMADAIRVIYQILVHKFESTTGEQRFYRANGSTNWFEKDIADSAGAYSKDAAETAD